MVSERADQAAVPTQKAWTFARAPRASPSGTMAFQQMGMHDKRRAGGAYLAPGEVRPSAVAPRRARADGALEPSARKLEGLHRPVSSAPPSTARVLLEMQRDQLAVANALAGNLRSLESELAAARAENELLRALAAGGASHAGTSIEQPQPQPEAEQALDLASAPTGPARRLLVISDLHCQHLRNRDTAAGAAFGAGNGGAGARAPIPGSARAVDRAHAPFVVLRAGSKAARTSRRPNTLSPQWLGSGCLTVELEAGVQVARLEVWDWTAGGSLALGRLDGWAFGKEAAAQAKALRSGGGVGGAAGAAGAVIVAQGQCTHKLVGTLQEVMPSVSQIGFRWKVEHQAHATAPLVPRQAQAQEPAQTTQPTPHQAPPSPPRAPPAALPAGVRLDAAARAHARIAQPADIAAAHAHAARQMEATAARAALPLPAPPLGPSAVAALAPLGASCLEARAGEAGGWGAATRGWDDTPHRRAEEAAEAAAEGARAAGGGGQGAPPAVVHHYHVHRWEEGAASDERKPLGLAAPAPAGDGGGGGEEVLPAVRPARATSDAGAARVRAAATCGGGDGAAALPSLQARGAPPVAIGSVAAAASPARAVPGGGAEEPGGDRSGTCTAVARLEHAAIADRALDATPARAQVLVGGADAPVAPCGSSAPRGAERASGAMGNGGDASFAAAEAEAEAAAAAEEADSAGDVAARALEALRAQNRELRARLRGAEGARTEPRPQPQPEEPQPQPSPEEVEPEAEEESGWRADMHAAEESALARRLAASEEDGDGAGWALHGTRGSPGEDLARPGGDGAGEEEGADDVSWLPQRPLLSRGDVPAAAGGWPAAGEGEPPGASAPPPLGAQPEPPDTSEETPPPPPPGAQPEPPDASEEETPPPPPPGAQLEPLDAFEEEETPPPPPGAQPEPLDASEEEETPPPPPPGAQLEPLDASEEETPPPPPAGAQPELAYDESGEVPPPPPTG